VDIVSALLRGNWQDFNWHDASRGPSAIAELLVLHIGHGDEKKLCGFNKKWLPWQRPLSDRNRISQQSSVPIRLPIRKISRKSVA